MKSTLTTKDHLTGYTELALAQCCIGLNVILAKFLMGLFPIFLLLTLRFAIGLTGMLAITYFQRTRFIEIYQRFMSLTTNDKILLIAQAACGGFLFNIFMLHGLQTTTATSAGIINSVTPVMIFILAAVFLREKITFQKGLSIVIVMIGLFVLNSGKTAGALQGALLGNILVLLAVVPEAFFTILSKSVGKKISGMEASIWVNFFNLIFFLPFTITSIIHFHPVHLTLTSYFQLLIYGLSGGIFFFLLWYRGLTKINVNTAALFTGVMPISTTLLAFVFLNESIHLNAVVGMLLVILAIFVGCRKI